MGWFRSPAVAGTFYPASESSLRSQVEGMLNEALPGGSTGPSTQVPPDVSPRVKALIAPHAGYIYSGPVAASAYARVAGLRGSVRRVVLLGPAHRYPFRGLAGCSAFAFQTPLGTVSLDEEWMERALGVPHVLVLDEAHEGEHCLEVQLPFLQVVLGDFALAPFVVGDARPEEVAEVLGALWNGPETLIVVSSDLSHYLPYHRAVELDETTAQAIEALRPEEIGERQACGRIPVAGLLLRARQEGLFVKRVDLRNSGDTAGPRHQVVGYGSFVFH